MPLGCRLMAGQRILVPSMGVRLPPSQPVYMARSSSGLGRRPLKAEITSSNLVRATNDCKAPTSVGAFSYAPPPASSIASHHTRAQPGRLNRRPVGQNATIRAITAKRTARALSSIRSEAGFWRDTLRAAHKLKPCLRKSGYARNSHAPAQLS